MFNVMPLHSVGQWSIKTVNIIYMYILLITVKTSINVLTIPDNSQIKPQLTLIKHRPYDIKLQQKQHLRKRKRE